jgi:hypothetical protein
MRRAAERRPYGVLRDDLIHFQIADLKIPQFSIFNFQFSIVPPSPGASVAHAVRRYTASPVSWCLLPNAWCIFLQIFYLSSRDRYGILIV